MLPKPSRLQAEQAWAGSCSLQSKCSSPLTFPDSPRSNLLQFINVFPVLRCLQGSSFQMWSNKCRAEGHDHFHEFAACATVSTTQDTFGCLSCQSTLLAHVQLAVYQNPRVLFCRAASQPSSPQPASLPEALLSHVQGFTSVLAEFCKLPVGPFLQPVQVPLGEQPCPSPFLTGPPSSASCANTSALHHL